MCLLCQTEFCLGSFTSIKTENIEMTRNLKKCVELRRLTDICKMSCTKLCLN